MSQHLESLQIGDYIEVRGPSGLMTYEGNGTRTCFEFFFHKLFQITTSLLFIDNLYYTCFHFLSFFNCRHISNSPRQEVSTKQDDGSQDWLDSWRHRYAFVWTSISCVCWNVAT